MEKVRDSKKIKIENSQIQKNIKRKFFRWYDAITKVCEYSTKVKKL